MTARLIVGIDPGVTTGFAAWDAVAQKLESVDSQSICYAMLRLQALQTAGVLHLVVFEDARLRGGHNLRHGVDYSKASRLQGAGSIKRDCQIWADWLGIVGCPYIAVSPKAKGAKVDAAQFKRLTGWTDRTNEHARDAAMLVYKRTCFNREML